MGEKVVTSIVIDSEVKKSSKNNLESQGYKSLSSLINSLLTEFNNHCRQTKPLHKSSPFSDGRDKDKPADTNNKTERREKDNGTVKEIQETSG